MQEAACFSPISTNFWATDFVVSAKYANMGTSKHNELCQHLYDLNVTESVNCPFHYTEGYQSFRTAGTQVLRGPEMPCYCLYGTVKLVAIVIEGT